MVDERLGRGTLVVARIESIPRLYGISLLTRIEVHSRGRGIVREKECVCRQFVWSGSVFVIRTDTNHLDADAREHLFRTLKDFRGIGIAISHDRDFLDALSTRTLRIHDGAVSAFEACYSAAREHWLEEAQREVEVRQALRARQRAIVERIQLTSRDKDAAHRQRSAGARMKNIHDHDGSSFARTGVVPPTAKLDSAAAR